jgi:hypothetical protein
MDGETPFRKKFVAKNPVVYIEYTRIQETF